jgi:drug/metabolite transporter (DMT)-like permease
MEVEIQAALSALAGALVVPLTELIKKLLHLENAVAKAVAALIVSFGGVFFLNFVYGNSLELANLLRIAGSLFIGVITTNAARVEAKKNSGG